MKSKYTQKDLNGIKSYSITERSSKMQTEKLCGPVNRQIKLDSFLSAIPDVFAGHDFKKFISQFRSAILEKKTVIWMMGAHSIKLGLGPLICSLLDKKIISHLAVNGAMAIHDIELSLFGHTSEDVQKGLLDGSFGMCRDTAAFINGSLKKNFGNELGYGECLALDLSAASPKGKSVLQCAYENDIPLTVHSALGTEIIHQHPDLDGPAYGEKALLDFKLFTSSLCNLSQDSLVINVGSAVIMPEIFLKALTVARNLGYDAFGFHTAVFDMIRHYRPTENVQRRPTSGSGDGYYFIGQFELLLPLVAGLVLDE